LYIGWYGSGTLRVEAGGEVSNLYGRLGFSVGSTGTATITGTGSTWGSGIDISVGGSGGGALRVEAGGHVNSGTGSLGTYANSTGMATITGVGSNWTNSFDLYIGRSGNGVLQTEAGGQISSDSGYLGYNAGSTGTATIAGAGSKWTNSSDLSVGYLGSGALRVEAGGQVSSISGRLGSTGTATIIGTGSEWSNSAALYVGGEGNSELTVKDGGQVTAATLYASLSDLHGNGTIAATTGAVLDADLQFNAAHQVQDILGFGAGGALTVTAAGGDLGVGYKGLGSMIISDGVAISSPTGYLGYMAGAIGTATITGAGSKWTSSSALYVGNSGSGELRVESGGEVFSSFGSLGLHGGATGTATITGAGSKWTNSSHLSVGSLGSGSLRVEGGGQVSSVSGSLGAGSHIYHATGTATIIGAGSKWTNGSDLHVGDFGSGALHVAAGGEVHSFSGRLGDASGSTGMAMITGAGSMWINNADLLVGRYGYGVLTITAGALVSVQGTLTIDSNGGGDSFINMATGGMLALWGDADDSLSQFLGLVAGTDAIRYWNAGLAGWTPLAAATLGVDYALQYQTTGDLTGYTLLTVLAPGPPGDFDGDGIVDGADLLAWQRGASPTPDSPADLAAWQANFGLGATTPVASAVPEPGSLMLIGLAMARLVLGRRLPRSRIEPSSKSSFSY
jgi:T5SS/PEP-CTERM-associated repeat protein